MLEDIRKKVLRQVGEYSSDEAAHREGKGDNLSAVTFNHITFSISPPLPLIPCT
jgi:hypothetical protein